MTPWPEDGSVKVHRIEPSGAIAVIVFIDATYVVPSGPMEGPLSPTDRTTHRSAPSAVSE
jgi:hypothetical protein